MYFIYEKCGRKRKAEKISCSLCKKYFLKAKRFISENNYCTKNCVYKSRENKISLQCSWCNNSFKRAVNKTKLAKHGYQFCKRKCKDEAQKINGIKEIHPKHYGDGSSVNYRKLAKKIYGNKCELCSWSTTVEIHHIDNNRKNNNIKNLCVLCPNCHSLTQSNKFKLDKKVIEDISYKIRKLRI